MKWFAIRTKPGFQVPQREYWTEPNASALKGKTRGVGYRMRSSVNPEQAAIETHLERAGFVHYMPAEFVAVRNRNKKGLYELRRFALLKGYAFVAEVDEAGWYRLLDVPGVHSVVADISGKALPIRSLDIHRLRMYEQNSRAVANAKVAALTKGSETQARRERKAISKATRKKLFPGREVKLIWGDKVGRDATVAAWQDEDFVKVVLKGLQEAETVTVPFEFLKTSDAA